MSTIYSLLMTHKYWHGLICSYLYIEEKCDDMDCSCDGVSMSRIGLTDRIGFLYRLPSVSHSSTSAAVKSD